MYNNTFSILIRYNVAFYKKELEFSLFLSLLPTSKLTNYNKSVDLASNIYFAFRKSNANYKYSITNCDLSHVNALNCIFFTCSHKGYHVRSWKYENLLKKRNGS